MQTTLTDQEIEQLAVDLESDRVERKESLSGGTTKDRVAQATLNIRTETIVENHVTEQRKPDYPLGAIQQILRNAVMHRSYEIHAPVYWYWFSDRVEIHSPGGLYGRVTEANFGQGGPSATDCRNQVVAEGLKVTGFVQRFGMGLEIARRRCLENGNPEPQYKISPSALVATLRARQ